MAFGELIFPRAPPSVNNPPLLAYQACALTLVGVMMSNSEEPSRAEETAYRKGWRTGLALGAIAIAATAFINLLSIEKSILAVVLALIAIRGAGADQAGRRGRVALAIAAVHLVAVAAFLVAFHDKLGRLLHLLQSLS